MFIAELNVPNFDDFDLSSLRTGIMAGSPCPEETMKQVIERMGADQISICYGMTETSPVSAQTSVDDTIERRVSTVGRVHPHLEVQIVDPESGRVLPRGETGEFCTRGYSLMLGYWNQPDKTAETIDADGWMHTGDLGVMDVDGYLNITGRIKDVILRGGENIYPREIEEFLLRHPDILDVQVVGVPDPEYGEQVMAWIRMKTDSTPLDADSIREYSTGRLAHYKIPRYVHLTDEFPMTITGKVRKVEMRRVSIELLDT
jgi:fatty-acyl-CoA synthase